MVQPFIIAGNKFPLEKYISMEKHLKCKDCDTTFTHQREPGKAGRDPVRCSNCRDTKYKKQAKALPVN